MPARLLDIETMSELFHTIVCTNVKFCLRIKEKEKNHSHSGRSIQKENDP
jgi:hypothetical protein